MRWSPKRRRDRDEQGAVAVIVAFSMTALLVVAGMVLDLGQARTDRLTNKSYTDAAATAGIQGTGLGTQALPFAGACTALAYLRVNDPEVTGMTSSWKTGAGTGIGTTDPCAAGSTYLNAVCVPSTPSSWASFSGTAAGGRITVEIKSGYLTPDPAFDPTGSADNSASGQGGCDQLAVILHETEHPGLGKIATHNNIVIDTRTVARRFAGVTSGVATAFLLLEQHACLVLAVTGSGNAHVRGNGAVPGSIHSDSLGDTCTSGQKIFSADQSSASIRAHKAVTGTAGGIITTTALSGAAGAVPANAYSQLPWICAEQTSGTCAAPTGNPVVGRAPVDNRYAGGVRNAMSAAAAQYTKGATPGSTAAGTPYWVMPRCTPTAADITNAAAKAAIFFNCPSGVTMNAGLTIAFPAATDFVINGQLSISNGASLSLPVAVRVYIKGVVGGAGVSATGTFIRINGGASYTPPPGTSSCAARAAAAASQVVIGNGSFTIGAGSNGALCNVTVLLADGSGFTGSTSLCPPPVPPDTGTGPVPYTNTCGGFFSVSGSSGIDWRGPNRVSGQAQPTDWANLEDLCFWSEASSGSSTIGGSGNVQVTGVFFAPNAVFTINGAGIQNIGANAQYIARRIIIGGSATVDLNPILTDTVATTVQPPTFGLVR